MFDSVLIRMERRARCKALYERNVIRRDFDEKVALLEEEHPIQEPETIFGALGSGIVATAGAFMSHLIFPHGIFLHMQSRFEGLFWEGVWLTACNIGAFFLAFSLVYLGFCRFFDAISNHKREHQLTALHAARDKLLAALENPQPTEEDIENARREYDQSLAMFREHPEIYEPISRQLCDWVMAALREKLPLDNGDALETETMFMLKNGVLFHLCRDDSNEELPFYVTQVVQMETNALFEDFRENIAEFGAAVQAVFEAVTKDLCLRLENRFEVVTDIRSELHPAAFTISVGLIEKAGEEKEE